MLPVFLCVLHEEINFCTLEVLNNEGIEQFAFLQDNIIAKVDHLQYKI